MTKLFQPDKRYKFTKLQRFIDLFVIVWATSAAFCGTTIRH